ncbi:MAG: hypothetical protein KAF91_28455 [Nostoc sp. TH1S01]|nr:hypothetical protein [Nostoc sp. TH1S01]
MNYSKSRQSTRPTQMNLYNNRNFIRVHLRLSAVNFIQTLLHHPSHSGQT